MVYFWMMEGVNVLKKGGIIHRDIEAENKRLVFVCYLFIYLLSFFELSWVKKNSTQQKNKKV
jgi:hypothetical protein